MNHTKATYRKRRHARIKERIQGSATQPRAQVYRSNQFITVQLIDDATNTILCSYSDMSDKKGTAKKTKTERATLVGMEIAKRAKEKGIATVSFDRAGYRYHGRVKALADAMREGGLQL